MDHLAILVASKVLKGVGIGMIELVVSIYVSEILAPSVRGSAIAFFHVGYALGAALMIGAGSWVLSTFKSPNLVRYVCISDTIPALIFAVSGALFPQSPRWLAQKDRWQQAAINLDKIQRMNQNFIKKKEIIQLENEENRRQRVIQAYTSGPTIRACSHAKLWGRKFRRQTLMSIFLMVSSQTTCVHVLMYFFDVLCQVCGLWGGGAKSLGIVHYLVTFVFALFLALAINKCRRKDSLIFGFMLVGTVLIGLGSLVSVYGKTAPGRLLLNLEMSGLPSSAVLASFLLFVSLHAMLITPVSWVYVCELFPGYARTKGISVAMVAYWISDAVLRLCVPLTVNYFKQYVLVAAGVITVLAGIVITQFPETQNLDDLEIEALYDRPKNDIEVQLQQPQLISKDIPIQGKEIKPPERAFFNDEEYHIAQFVKKDETTVNEKLSIFTSTASSPVSTRIEKQSIVSQVPSETPTEIPMLTRMFPPPTTADNSYFSQDWANDPNSLHQQESQNLASDDEQKLAPELTSTTTDHNEQSAQDYSFHHCNSEGSPLKAGVTYEPTTFLRHDVLHLAQKDHYDTWKQNGKLQLMSKYTL